MRSVWIALLLVLGLGAGLVELLHCAEAYRMLQINQLPSGGIGAVSYSPFPLVPVGMSTVVVVAAALRNRRRARYLFVVYVVVLLAPLMLLNGGVVASDYRGMWLFVLLYSLALGILTFTSTWWLLQSELRRNAA